MSLLYESLLCLDFEYVTRCYRRMFPCVAHTETSDDKGNCLQALVAVLGDW